jgi:hypothetical protein
METKREIIKEGLELGLSLSQMKFACPNMAKCNYLTRQKNQKETRQKYCHNAINYQNCAEFDIQLTT